MNSSNNIEEVFPPSSSNESNLGQQVDLMIEMYENQDIDSDELEFFISILTGE